MPYRTGTSANADTFESANRRFFRTFRRWLTGAPRVRSSGFVGTGNGVIGLIDTKAGAPAESWVIHFTSATAFTVTGSVSGAQAAGTTGTNYTSNTPAGRLSFKITVGATPFVNGDEFTVVVGVTFTGTVDFAASGSTVTRGSGSWVTDGFEIGTPVTITGAVDAGNNAYFQVAAVTALVLTLSGVIADETADTGVTVVQALAGFDAWVIDRYDPFSADLETIFHGTGLAGADAIYVGMRINETPASSIFCWELRGFTGFNSGFTFTGQPGISPATFYTLGSNGMPFWFIASGRRFQIVNKPSTTYNHMHCGFFLPYATPTEYPYPLVIMGQSLSAITFSNTGANYTNPAFTRSTSFWRDTNGAWVTINQSSLVSGIWPLYSIGAQWINLMAPVAGSDYPLIPAVLLSLSGSVSQLTDFDHMEAVGTLDNIYVVPGTGNAAETLLTIGGVVYVVFQNIFRVTGVDYFALALA